MIFIDSEKFICRRQGCQGKFNDYVEGVDYGIYIKNNSDCIPCQKKCEMDKNCGAVWCGSEKKMGLKNSGNCVWWKTGKCLDDYEVIYSYYAIGKGFTCYKGNVK